jgi:Siphovirus ReqiPepy6 Gp37-like protein
VELFTLNRGFLRQYDIDKFTSAIWTERYYGDSEFELVVPATSDFIQKLPIGTFVGLVGSKEVMLVDYSDSEKGSWKITGSSLLKFLNNRFIRVTAAHEDRYWYINGQVPGVVLYWIIYYMCFAQSPYLNGTVNIGIPNAASLAIPNLGLKAYDTSGSPINVAVPYGPVYDAMRDIATTYGVGIQITLEWATDTSYSIQFRSYKGLDRTSRQTVNPVRFSPQMDTLTDIKELQSIVSYKTIAYSFCPPNPDGLATVCGTDQVPGGTPSGFDLRALLTFEEDITTDLIGGSQANLVSLLNARAHNALANSPFSRAIDGQIVPLHQYQYGIDYSLGDIIEVQGNSGIVQNSMVTEYIRAQDNSGEKAYPTVAMLG